ncbi:P-loop containing nucleoside triphosphate hydrolase protein [Gymnopilus junonius]|uniref:P-loop containing nucleoside triphosphate hydrolase protein n=1 Tax=Gymnopilus junonius TaxID=109634 RepID=A0A9P5TRL6_GYMJU|nr:P-loop containing nucleoside triphosphate hydrolase protein [Gymnopilus junonius]
MDVDIEELAQHLVEKLHRIPAPQRLLVGVAGIPASGKSTFTVLLTERVNAILRERSITTTSSGSEGSASSGLGSSAEGVDAVGGDQSSRPLVQDQAILVGLDGWHLSRAKLDVFPNPQNAHDRRGIHWTFDGEGYVAFIKKLRDASNTLVITAPSFDHALKDPTPDAVSIYPYHRIVIIEGLYVFLAIQPWSEAGFLLDERVFIEVDIAEARKRLVKRHVVTGIAKDMKEAEWRADENDMPNGLFVISNMLEPTWTIQSKDIPLVE